ncbi:MAG: hypothetical protein WD048_05710 [Chitinophagales bacterium]
MVVRKSLLTGIVILLCAGIAFAQEPYAGKGLLRMQGTLAPAYQPGLKVTNFYLHGDLEYYVEDKISIRADSYIFLGSQQKPAIFDQKIMSFFGAMYHFPHKRIDPFVGIQPGIAISSVNYTSPEGNNTTSDMAISPLISPIAGVNLYVGKVIHFFAVVRYMYGRHMSDAPEAVSMSEINGSFGLGFNFGRRNRR